MRIQSAVFEVSAPDLKSCPRWGLPEFAFIGRSNVGKSSLINLLTERRELAKVSDLPGKTQLMNFFRINGNWALVDLPGYGYAHVSRERRADFNEATADFLAGRKNLRRIFVLIDSRLPPQAIDLEFLRWLDTGHVPFTLVFTKTDKHSAAKSQANVALFSRELQGLRNERPEILLSSSKTGNGRAEILGSIERAMTSQGQPG